MELVVACFPLLLGVAALAAVNIIGALVMAISRALAVAPHRREHLEILAELDREFPAALAVPGTAVDQTTHQATRGDCFEGYDPISRTFRLPNGQVIPEGAVCAVVGRIVITASSPPTREDLVQIYKAHSNMLAKLFGDGRSAISQDEHDELAKMAVRAIREADERSS